MHLTNKQKAILSLIVAGNPDGPIDLDQLIDRLLYNPSKDSMHFSLRALTKKGLVEKGALEVRRGRARRLFTVTPLGLHAYALLCPKVPALAAAPVVLLNPSGEVEDLSDEGLFSLDREPSFSIEGL